MSQETFLNPKNITYTHGTYDMKMQAIHIDNEDSLNKQIKQIHTSQCPETE
jgi:hypothetical protein